MVERAENQNTERRSSLFQFLRPRLKFERYRQYGVFPCFTFEVGKFEDWYIAVCIGSRFYKVRTR